MCRDPKCPKNQVSYYKDRKGLHANITATHYKYSKVKGPQDIMLMPGMIIKFAYLDQALLSLEAKTPTYFFKRQGNQEPYHKAYFSTICSKQLVFQGKRLTSNHMRHLFITGWRDFINHPSTILLRHTQAEMQASQGVLWVVDGLCVLDSAVLWGWGVLKMWQGHSHLVNPHNSNAGGGSCHDAQHTRGMGLL